MSENSRYCPHCGAANTPESELCFSCQLPFAETQETTRGIVLMERYQLLTQVGSGGFGGVYRSVDLAEGQQIVAVKEINLRGLSTREIIEATDGFNREVNLLSALRHPNLPRIRDTFTDAEHWYVVMDFIEGETLEAYLQHRAGSSLPLQEALEMALQLCAVLDYLHTREPVVIFRDLKPSNVMRTPAGRVYLIDFGIARLFTPGKLKDTMPFGSPGYAAPEQYGRAQTTPQADVYSLGALLHALLTGNDPAESPFRFAPLPIGESPELAELDALIQRMVATAPEERPASVAEVKAVLQRLSEGMQQKEYRRHMPIWTPPVPAGAPVTRAGLTRRKMLTRALTIGGTVVGVAGIVSICGGILSMTSHPTIVGTIALPPPSPGATRQKFIYRGHKGPITALSWSPDGTMVASGSADGTVQVWRAADGALLYTLVGYTDAVTSVVWASDRMNVIASAGNDDGTVQVWDALRDHRDRVFHGAGRVLALAWQDKSPWIASGGTDQDIYTWNATTGAKGASYRGHRGNVNALVWLSSNDAQASVAGLSHTLPAETPTATPNLPPPPTPTLPLSLAHLVASGGADGTVQLWDAQTGKRTAILASSRGGVTSLALVQNAPYAHYLVATYEEGTVSIWSLEYLSEQVMYGGHTRRVNAVTAFYKAGQTYYDSPAFASAGDDQAVLVWSLNNSPLLRYTEHRAPVKAVAASPVDDRIVSGDQEGLVHLWTVIPPRRQ